MLKKITLAAALAATTALFAGPALAQAPKDVCPATLKMADTGIEGMSGLEESFGPFARKFEEIAGVKIALYGLSNRTAAGTALQFGEVDLVFAGPSEFVLFSDMLKEEKPEILFAILRPHYGTSFFVKDESPIQSLADIKGKKVALKDVGSTSGHIFPSQMLVEAGYDMDKDLQIVMAGDVRAAALVNGDVDVLGGGNSDIEDIAELDPNGKYRTIAKSEILPGDPVILRAGLPAECKTALRATLEANKDALWAALIETPENQDKFLDKDASLTFDLTPADYDIVRQAYAAARIPLN
ncbi:phosphate/phosphite/phosphonate ABC transporter substrate-binding protein [Limoniibacter endophyticus]|uniref:Phosphonate transport system substrate-binding protein n=1 Tax=Limoniibacter endophyticus TaxID=1565040 RepID=A0A8J3DRP1_9HYPH|nr:phosphate/phosphite/phosphonate ABC transporter substrate-binding protein [Limoniibacter endophyticus]GHC70320.1 hypothetical protein GCM10010136_16480 [Limoniibacter endophyticus]